MTEKDYLLKIVVVGDSGVGKSSMLTRYAEGRFDDKFVSTIGVDFKLKTIDVQGKKVLLQMWDTGGQERFRTISQTYYRGAQAVVVAYSTVDTRSFKNVPFWIGEVQQHATEEVHSVLVGTKTDMVNIRSVSTEEGQALAKELGMQFYETSAKTAQNLEEMFYRLAVACIHERPAYGPPPQRLQQPVDLLQGDRIPNSGGKKGCCN